MRYFPALALLCAFLTMLAGGAVVAAPRLAVDDLHGAHWGMHVVDLANGRVVFAHAPDDLMVPASTMKLLTAAAVVRRRSVFPTAAWSDVGGKVWVVGTGDPSIGSTDVDALAAAVVRARGTEVVLFDGWVRGGARLGPGWAWDDETEAFSAPLGAFGVNENVVRVRVVPALAVGAPPRVMSEPEGVLEIQSEAVTGGTDADDTTLLQRLEGSNRVVVSGVAPMGDVVEQDVAVFDGTDYFATLLSRSLARLGSSAAVRRARTGERLGDGKLPLVYNRDTPMVPLLAKTLKESDNYYAEQLMRGLGTGLRPAEGLDLAARTLGDLGLPAGSYRQVDGSGLSRMNLLSAAQLVTVLRAMAGERAFVDALPIAGVDGTLERRFTKSRLRGLLRAKTGSMGGISALAGYLCDAAGKPRYAFAFIVNGALGSGRAVKAAEEQTVEAVLGPLVGRP